MAVTIGQLISEVRVTLKEATTDSTLTDKYIWSILDRHIKWLIKRQSNALKLIHFDDIFQTLKGIQVAPAPTIDDCLGVKSKCMVYRTLEKLPDIYEDEDGVIIKSVFTIDGSMDFSPIKVNEYIRKLENPDMKYDKSRYYYYNNGWLYFPNNKIKMVMVKALFTDNIDNVCSDCPAPEITCVSKQDQKLWVPDSIKAELMQFVLKDISIVKQLPQDEQIDKDQTRKN